MLDTTHVSASVQLDPRCEIRTKFSDDDVTIWFETGSTSFDLCVQDDRMAEKLRDLFAEAVQHFARVEAEAGDADEDADED
ncbi:hypothetical protein BJF78_12765 [Pseudonocardia sp. CNS-139]|nr:hypothetical protein BJF78_12765 [Pseudonocardia sp. CNS-139]